MKNKRLLVLVMSVGDYATNYTARLLAKIGGKANTIVCLPKAFEENAKTYERNGIRVHIYDQEEYINEGFEYFGFKPRNCGGIGRQGIAEAVEEYAEDDNIILELDDDYSSFMVRKREGEHHRVTTVQDFSELEDVYNAMFRFYKTTGIELAGSIGATPPSQDSDFTNRKIFNNFIMHKGNRLNFIGFKSLCSDDYRFNIYNNIFNHRPMLSTKYFVITFHQNQGDRDDGNAPLYNKDCSWKKSYSLKMMTPWQVEQSVSKESCRVLFRENSMPSKFYPPIMLSDENGNIIAKARL